MIKNVLLVAACLVAAPPATYGQTSSQATSNVTGVNATSPVGVVNKVKALYAAAEYENALAVLANVPAENPLPELDQYRAFCLIALGDQRQAETAIAQLLTHTPLYEPDAAETSPRVIEVFREVRTQVLPAVAKQLYLDAKTSLERKERQNAIGRFETLLQLLGTQSAPDPTLDDIKVLAEGFLDLSRALPEARPAENVVSSAAPAEPTAGSPPPIVAKDNWERPVMIRQVMPPWNAPDAISRQTQYRGVVRVNIGIDGTVVSSEIVRSVHPLYDRLLLSASRNWLYQPARQDGKPVAAEILVEVLLQPE
jgi:tetratricopeptide (TPR) repeat protein